jgi:hypothetical protein
MARASEKAPDAPIGSGDEVLLVRALALDPGSFSGEPNGHQPTYWLPANTNVAWMRSSWMIRVLSARFCAAVYPFGLTWKPRHQQPFQTPLFSSTSWPKASQIESSQIESTKMGIQEPPRDDPIDENGHATNAQKIILDL